MHPQTTKHLPTSRQLRSSDPRALLLPLDGNVVPRSTLVVLLGDLLDNRCEVSLVLHSSDHIASNGMLAIGDRAYLLGCDPLLLW